MCKSRVFKLTSLLLVFALLGHDRATLEVEAHVPDLFNFEWPSFKLPNFFGQSNTVDSNGEEVLDPIDYFLLDVVPLFIGQKPSNQNGTKAIFKQYAMDDESNDDAYQMSGHELILRSGYKYESFDCVADDGYITTMTRVINPLVERRNLRYPPVLMMHGGTIDPTAYLLASSIQHHPEPWPRTDKDGPFTSWNRSLAFVLANNGFDVWLAETRGSNERNKRHIKTKAAESAFKGKNQAKNMTTGETVDQLLKQWDFWAFSQDDIIQNEVPAQINLVLNQTGAKKISMMTYSLSTPISLSFLSIRPDYAEKIQGFVSMAPIVSGYGTNSFVKLMFQWVCPLVPDKIGTLVLSDTLLTQPLRELLVFASRPKKFRYSFVKLLISFLMGPSAKYETLLELNMLGHMLRNLSFKEMKQLCQQMAKNKLSKFDYGPIKNLLIYNQTEPPVYDLSNLKLKDWIIVAAANDKLGTLEVMDHLISLVHPKPIAKIVAPGFNHIDLIAGVENDRYVNMPILKYLESQSLEPEERDPMVTSSARQLDIRTLLPPDFTPEKLNEHTKKLTKTFSNFTSLNPTDLIMTIQKSWADIFASFGKILPIFPNLDRD